MNWAPKPLRPNSENPLFEMVEAPTVVKSLTPIQRQRLSDGTPHTVTASTALRPADPVLSLPSTLVKGSLVEKYDERPKQPKQDPEDPMTVVKSYLTHRSAESVEKSASMSKSVEKMNAAIADVLSKTGVE